MSKSFNRIFVISMILLLIFSFSASALTYDELKAENYDMFLRVWVVFGIISLSIIYRFFFFDKKKADEEILMCKKFRLKMLGSFSKWSVVLAPLFFLFFHPDFEIITLFNIILIILTPLTAIYLHFLSLDILRYGIRGLFVMAGKKSNNEKVNKFAKEHLGGRR